MTEEEAALRAASETTYPMPLETAAGQRTVRQCAGRDAGGHGLCKYCWQRFLNPEGIITGDMDYLLFFRVQMPRLSGHL